MGEKSNSWKGPTEEYINEKTQAMPKIWETIVRREIVPLSLFYFINVLLSGTFPMVSQMTQTEIVCKRYAPGKLGYQFTTSG